MWRSYIAIGDSFSEGLCDPDPRCEGRYRGWTDRLAEYLARAQPEDAPPFKYANLAIRGRKLDRILTEQLPMALEQRPELISIVGGGNDVLRPGVDLDRLAERVSDSVAQARAAGSDVMLVTPGKPSSDTSLIRHTAGRFGIFTAHLGSIARQHDAYLVDLWGVRDLSNPRVWAPDRIHLTSTGHQLVVTEALRALGLSDLAPVPPRVPSPISQPRLHRVRNDAQWAYDHLRPWVYRRLTGRSTGDSVRPKYETLTPFSDQH